LSLACIASLAGLPEVTLPVAEVDGCPVGLSLIARPGGEALLLAAARQVAATLL
jgi:amidase